MENWLNHSHSLADSHTPKLEMLSDLKIKSLPNSSWLTTSVNSGREGKSSESSTSLRSSTSLNSSTSSESSTSSDFSGSSWRGTLDSSFGSKHHFVISGFSLNLGDFRPKLQISRGKSLHFSTGLWSGCLTFFDANFQQEGEIKRNFK